MMLSVKDIDVKFQKGLSDLKENEPDIYGWFVRSAREFGGFDDKLMDFLISLSIKSVTLFSECLEAYLYGLDTDYLSVYYDIYNKYSGDDYVELRHDFLNLFIDCASSNISYDKVSDVLEKCNYDYSVFSLSLENQIYLNNITSFEEVSLFIDKLSKDAGDYKGKDHFNYYIDIFQNAINLYGGMPSDVFDYLKGFSEFENGNPRYVSFSEPLHNVFIFLVNRCASSVWFKLGYELYQHAISTENYFWVNIIDSIYDDTIDVDRLMNFLYIHKDLKYPYLFIKYSEKLKAQNFRFNMKKINNSVDISAIDDIYDTLDNVSYNLSKYSDNFDELTNKYDELHKSYDNLNLKLSDVTKNDYISDSHRTDNSAYYEQIDSFGGYLLSKNNRDFFNDKKNEVADDSEKSESFIKHDSSDNTSDFKNIDNIQKEEINDSHVADSNIESNENFSFHNSNEAFSKNSYHNDNDIPVEKSYVVDQDDSHLDLDSDGNQILSFSDTDDEGSNQYNREINDAISDLNIDYRQESGSFHKKFKINNSGNIYLQRKFVLPVGQSTSVNGNSFFDRMARHILFANFVNSVPEDAKLKSIYGYCVNDPHFGKKSLLYIGNIAKTNKLSMDELFKYLLKYPSVDELKSKYEGLNNDML